MSYKLEWVGNNVFAEFYGEAKMSEIATCNELIYGDHRFDNMKFQFIDFLKVTKFIIKNEEFEDIILLDKSATRWNNNVKIACVTVDELIKKLIVEYTNALKDFGWTCKQFETIEAAKNWCEA